MTDEKIAELEKRIEKLEKTLQLRRRNAWQPNKETIDNVSRYCDSNISTTNIGETEKSVLYDHYRGWAGKNNILLASPAQFSWCIIRRYKTITPANARASTKNRKRVWKNIGIADSGNCTNTKIE